MNFSPFHMRAIRTILLFAVLFIAGGAFAQDAEGEGGKSAGMSKKQQEKHLAKKERKDKKSGSTSCTVSTRTRLRASV